MRMCAATKFEASVTSRVWAEGLGGIVVQKDIEGGVIYPWSDMPQAGLPIPFIMPSRTLLLFVFFIVA
jgi:hypothetical protein